MSSFISDFQGATIAQARAALKQHRDVMQAAERIFEGKFDHVRDEDGDVHMASTAREVKRTPRLSVMLVLR
jgi:hypothetical protein